MGKGRAKGRGGRLKVYVTNGTDFIIHFFPHHQSKKKKKKALNKDDVFLSTVNKSVERLLSVGKRKGLSNPLPPP